MWLYHLGETIRKIKLKGRLKIFQTTFLLCLVIYPLHYCLMPNEPETFAKFSKSPKLPLRHLGDFL